MKEENNNSDKIKEGKLEQVPQNLGSCSDADSKNDITVQHQLTY